MAADPRTVSNK